MVRHHWMKAAAAVAGSLGLTLGLAGVTNAAVTTRHKAAASRHNAATSRQEKAKGKPIVIGAVIDETNTMKPFDQPALQAAKVWAQRINAAGGVRGRPIVFKVYNDQLQSALTRSDALKAISQGAKILWTTCDVTYATPAIQVGLAHRMLVVSPCTGTNEMGPSRFGAPGKFAFSFGNAPTSDGAVLARLLIQKGWKTATVVTDKLLTYFDAVCQNFTTDFQKDGGKIVTQLTYTSFDHTVTQVAQKAATTGASATVLCTTTTPTLPAFVTSLRTLGNSKPIVGPWAIDGGFWEPSTANISNNLWWSTYASVFGDDPNPLIRNLYTKLKSMGETPLTGGYITGPSALQGIITAIRRTNGNLSGSALAAQMVKFKNVPTLSGPVSFSAKFHAVIGRPYRIIEDSNGKPHFVEMLSPGKYAGGA